MIGYRYPVQGLQPFTKTFGQPLHEPDVEEYSSNEIQPQLQPPQQNHDIVVDAKYVASQIEKSMGFSYGDDSDGDDSDASVQLEENSEQPLPPEDNDDFLTAHSDILPADAPIDTINTLKALKFHIETSENRCFTNLERQLLATIVQHGIFNANKEENVPNSNEQAELGEQVQQSEVILDSATADNNNQNELEVHTATQFTQSSVTQVPPNLEEDYIRENNTPSDAQSVSQKVTQSTHSSVTHVPPNLEENYIKENITPDAQSVSQKVTQSTHSSVTQVPPHLERNYIRENITPSDAQSVSQKVTQSTHSSVTQVPPHLEGNYIRENITPSDAQSVSRKALLPTPGSYEEVSHVIMSENEGAKNFSKPTLPINEQKKMSKTVQSLKISEKLARIQNSYHPDDEPTLQLLESMANKNEEESGYDDLLKSYSKTKSQLEVEKEPKYKSKTKILLPSSEFLKRQEKHHASRHERYEKMQYDSQSHGSNRRVVRREEYEREKRGKDQEREPSRRRVKVHYKEDTPDRNLHSTRSQSYQETERRMKSNSPEEEVEQNLDASTEEKAVDILANLITQKFLSTMTEVEEHPGSNGQDVESVLQTIAQSAVPKTVAQPTSTLPNNFPTPPFIPGNPPFLPPPPHLMATPVPILSAPLPIVTGPMMVHPGPVKRSNLITINLDHKKNRKKKKNADSKDAMTDSSVDSRGAQVPTEHKVIDLDGDVEEGEIS